MTDLGDALQSSDVEAASVQERAQRPMESANEPDVDDVGIAGTAAAKAPPLTDRERERLFNATYGAHFDYVWHCLRRFGVWDRDLEDAAHELFIIVHRRLDDFDQSRPIKPWLMGIAFRVASDFRRRAQHRREIVGHDVEAVDDRKTAVDMVAEHEARALVAVALESLDDEKRAVFVHHELEGRPIPEVAELVGAPLNTCYSRLRLARERFKEAVIQLRQNSRNETTERAR